MTEEKIGDVVPKDLYPDDPDGLTWDDVLPKDVYLDILLNSVVGEKDDHLPGEFGLTVISGGAVVSGMVIARKAWVQLLIESVRDAGSAPLAEVLEGTLPRFEEELDAHSDRRDKLNLLAHKRTHIHMRDARIFNGATTNVPLWRGALEDITGWSMGSFSKD